MKQKLLIIALIIAWIDLGINQYTIHNYRKLVTELKLNIENLSIVHKAQIEDYSICTIQLDVMTKQMKEDTERFNKYEKIMNEQMQLISFLKSNR